MRNIEGGELRNGIKADKNDTENAKVVKKSVNFSKKSSRKVLKIAWGTNLRKLHVLANRNNFNAQALDAIDKSLNVVWLPLIGDNSPRSVGKN